MMKAKTIRKVKTAVKWIVSIFCIFGLLFAAVRHVQKEQERKIQEGRKYALYVNWGLSIPESFEEVYYTYSLDLQGKGYRYGVYQAPYYGRVTLRAGLPAPSDPSQYSSGNDTLALAGEEVKDLVSRMEDELSVPTDMMIPSDISLYWELYERDEFDQLLLFYDTGSATYYLIDYLW